MFVYKEWENFCSKIHKLNFNCITAFDALEVSKSSMHYAIIKHDVESAKKSHQNGKQGMSIHEHCSPSNVISRKFTNVSFWVQSIQSFFDLFFNPLNFDVEFSYLFI